MERGSEKKKYVKANVKSSRGDKYKKFRGNKIEGQGFADKRKRKIQHEYLKILKKQRKEEEHQTRKQNVTSTTEHEKSGSPEKLTKFSKSQWQSQKRQEEKAKKKREALKKKREREEALAKYQARKQEKNKKLCKRTYKGQPVMKNQMELLLTQIEKQVNQT